MSDYYVRPVFQVEIPSEYFDHKYSKNRQYSCTALSCKMFSEARPTQKYCGECGNKLSSSSKSVLDQLNSAFHDAHPDALDNSTENFWEAALLEFSPMTRKNGDARVKVVVLTFGVTVIRYDNGGHHDTNFSIDALANTFLPKSGLLSTLWSHPAGSIPLATDLQNLHNLLREPLKKKIDDFFDELIGGNKVSCSPILTLMPYEV